MHVVRSKVKASGDCAVFVWFMTGSRCERRRPLVASAVCKPKNMCVTGRSGEIRNIDLRFL